MTTEKSGLGVDQEESTARTESPTSEPFDESPVVFQGLPKEAMEYRLIIGRVAHILLDGEDGTAIEWDRLIPAAMALKARAERHPDLVFGLDGEGDEC